MVRDYTAGQNMAGSPVSPRRGMVPQSGAGRRPAR
jgi:hypothetical protein